MRGWWSKWRNLRLGAAQALSRAAAHRDLPADSRSDDLYLVEFPKSGVTWLSFLMGNVNLLLSGGGDRQATFFNIQDLVPDIELDRHLGPPSLPVPGHRLIKSHATFNAHYNKVVYLVRDPRNVMASYHPFLERLGWFEGSLEAMIADRRFGIAAWCAHVTGWLDGASPSRSFALFRYEELIADTRGQLRELYRLLGFDLADAVVDRAIERASIERMREDEVRFNARHPALGSFEFVRRDAPVGPRVTLSAEARETIERAAGPVMERLGYRRG